MVPLDDAAGEFSVLEVWAFLIRYRTWIIAPAALLGLALSVPRLFKPSPYKSVSRFVLQGRAAPAGGISGIAAQFGVSLPGADVTQTPSFYADVAESRTVLGALADAKYTVRENGKTRTGTLADLLDVEGETPALRRELTIERLDRVVSVTEDRKISTVNVAVTTAWPELSREINARILTLVNDFNARMRKSAASSELQFAEAGVAEAAAELRHAEERLEAFLLSNRVATSPSLSVQEQRLQRDVSFRQAVYTTLAQNAEQARLNAERDTPVITIVEAPSDPVRPESRKVIVFGLVGVILGAALGLLCAYGKSVVTARRV